MVGVLRPWCGWALEIYIMARGLLSTLAQFATAMDVRIAELKLEAFVPAANEPPFPWLGLSATADCWWQRRAEGSEFAGQV
jgi:hypothetical protein